MADNLLTLAEAAARFRVHTYTFRRWIKTGKLEGLTVLRTPGGQPRFREAEIEALLRGQTGDQE